MGNFCCLSWKSHFEAALVTSSQGNKLQLGLKVGSSLSFRWGLIQVYTYPMDPAEHSCFAGPEVLLQVKVSPRDTSFDGWGHSGRKTLGDQHCKDFTYSKDWYLKQASTAVPHTDPHYNPSALVQTGDEDENQNNELQRHF